MSALFFQQTATVYVGGDDAIVRNALVRLLSLEPSLRVAELKAETPTGVVIDDALIEDLKDLSIADFIKLVKTFPAAALDAMPERHLRAVPSAEDMRTLLSDREMQVVRLVAEGLSNKEISVRLDLSDKTVKNHISHILAKLNLSARTQVAVHALRSGIV